LQYEIVYLISFIVFSYIFKEYELKGQCHQIYVCWFFASKCYLTLLKGDFEVYRISPFGGIRYIGDAIAERLKLVKEKFFKKPTRTSHFNHIAL